MKQSATHKHSGENTVEAQGLWSNVSRLEIAAFVVISLIGIGLRLHAYFQFRSLWNDEANVAINLVSRTFAQLLDPLDYDEVAPLGFLLIEKAVMTVLGNADYILRIVPLLAGLAAVPLTYIVAKKLLTGVAPLLALLLFALSTTQIYFASELKQFSTDVLSALIIVLIGANVLRQGLTTSNMLWLALAGMTLTWLSHPSVFVVGGVLLTIGLRLLRGRDRAGLLRLAVVAVLIIGMLATQFSVILYHAADNRTLSRYWSWAFAPALSSDAPKWLLAAVVETYGDPLELPFNLFTVGLAALGVFSLASRRWPALSLAAAPILLALVASALRLYPFTGRFLLFAAPLMFMVISEGVAALSGFALRWNRPAAVLVALACATYLAYPLAVTAVKRVESPLLRDHIKPVMAYLQKNRQDGDVIYLYYMAKTQYAYYAPFYDLDGVPTVKGITARREPRRYLEDLERLEGTPRVWFLFSHNYRSGWTDEQAFFLKRLDRAGIREAELVAPGAAIYLYDLSMNQ